MGEPWDTPSPRSNFTPIAQTRASLRPPIFNPYDRFTKPEFDAWIGDITGSLRRALNQDAEPEVDSPSRHSSSWNTIPDRIRGGLNGRAQSPASSDIRDEDSALEDSFARIASRKAKGKARDPREGPGLGLKGQPIELLSDSEEEEVVDSLEAEAVSSDGSDNDAREGSSGETDSVESELDEGGEPSPGRPGTSTQHIIAFSSREDSGHDQEVAGHSDAARHTGYEDLEFPRNTDTSRESDGVGNEGFAVLGDRRETDELPIPSQSATTFNVELVDPWDGPRTFAEDYYSGGDRLAPDFTPNHLTPVSRSPAPALIPGMPTVSNTGPDEDKLSPSPSILSMSPSPKLQNTVGGDEIDEILQYDTAVATSIDQEDVGEPAAGSYHDRIGFVDVTVHAVEDTEPEAVESAEGVKLMRARLISKENPTSSHGRGLDIIWVPPSDDDEHNDGDGEEDEGTFLGVVPLGTSDLDIRDDWYATDRRKESDDTSEEEEIQELVPAQTADDVAKTAVLPLPQFSEAVSPNGLNAPLVDPQAPILASTFQLTDADSFGDLPVSSPPSETPSPTPDQPFDLQQHSIEQLLADLERQAPEKRRQAPKSPGLLARQSEAETTNTWASRELENILSGEISVPDNVAGISGSALMGRSTPQETVLSARYPEYIVEEVKFGTEVLLPDDDLGDARSIPPPGLAEVVEMVQLYEVEEPRTDGRLTEEPETNVKSSLDDGTTASQPIVSLVESDATSITSERHAHAIPPTEVSLPTGVPASDGPQADVSSAVPSIPAPIVADPSVPDPVPGGSSPPSLAVTDTLNTTGLSVIPPAVLRVIDYDFSQIGSGTSGLFTPARRSEGGTPVELEDEVAEVLTIPHSESDKGVATTSTPLQAEDNPSSIGHDEDDRDAKADDAVGVDDFIEPSQLVLPNERHLGTGDMDVGSENPGVNTVESAEVSPPPDRGSVTLAVSQSPKEDNDISSGIPLKGYPEDSSVLGPNISFLQGTPSIAGGDEDADGEADPDYPPAHGTKKTHENPAHQSVGEDSEVLPREINNDIHSPNATTFDLEKFPTSASTQRQEPEAVGSPDWQDNPLEKNGDVQDTGDLATFAQSTTKASNGGVHPTQTLKRKRRDSKLGPARITRSKSGVGVARGKKGPVLSSRRAAPTSERAQSERDDTNIDADSLDDGASESASMSSGTSAVYRLLHATSRAGSVDSSTSGDAPWTSPATSSLGRVIPLIHAHGLHHHHGWSVPPRLISHTPSADPPKDTHQGKVKSPTSTPEPSTPSLKRAPSMNSPVTRSNCRFHKISLPRGEGEARAYFVVPGCALGDGELMNSEDIRDEGFSTHEDHKRILPNVETLDLSPYLVGVLRQLVGVDLLREQQEIFYLPNEEEKPKKRRQTGVLESLRPLRRQSISSNGPLARDHSPRPSEVSQPDGRGSPRRSISGSAVSASVREGSVVHNEDEDSALSDRGNDDDPSETPPAKRHEFSSVQLGPPPENTAGDGELVGSAMSERSTSAGKEPTITGKAPATRRSKRKNLNYDAAAYKPNEDEVNDDEVEEAKTRRNSTRRATKRSRTMEESSSANLPKSKKTRLGRSISVAGAGAMDS